MEERDHEMAFERARFQVALRGNSQGGVCYYLSSDEESDEDVAEADGAASEEIVETIGVEESTPAEEPEANVATAEEADAAPGGETDGAPTVELDAAPSEETEAQPVEETYRAPTIEVAAATIEEVEAQPNPTKESNAALAEEEVA